VHRINDGLRRKEGRHVRGATCKTPFEITKKSPVIRVLKEPKGLYILVFDTLFKRDIQEGVGPGGKAGLWTFLFKQKKGGNTS